MSVKEIKTTIAHLEAAELKELADFIAERLSEVSGSAEMDEARFWAVIQQLDWRQEGDDEAVLAPAAAALSQLSEEAIRAFADIQARLLYLLDGKNYADAYVGEGDFLSADGFLYARCAVVANGREAYYRILNHPEQMPQDVEFEALLGLPEKAWQLRTGGKNWNYLPPYNYETGFNESGWGSLAIKL